MQPRENIFTINTIKNKTFLKFVTRAGYRCSAEITQDLNFFSQMMPEFDPVCIQIKKK